MRLGTRASALALAQAKLVADLLGGCGVVPLVTSGDRAQSGGNANGTAEDKSRWVRELEEALATGAIDVAVHSAKDLPGEQPGGLSLVGAPARARPEDVLCGAAGLDGLPAGARIGTSSIRRAAQLRAARADLRVVAMRGNVDTRLDKLARGEFDAIVLAGAGLERLGRTEAVGEVLDPARFVPAPGQGTLALQARAEDPPVHAAIARITDRPAFDALLSERALAAALGAGCDTPLGAYAAPCEGGVRMRAWVGLPDGSAWIGDELHGDGSDPEALGREVAGRLRLAGADELLSAAREMAVEG